jgi:hypothetical protein
MTLPILGHFSRAQSSGTWITGYEPLLSDWTSFDWRSAQSVNGDDGGTWAPATGNPIIINGQGLVVTGQATISGIGATLKSLAAGAFLLTSSEWPALGATHTSRSRTIMSSCLNAATNITTIGISGAAPTLPNLQYGAPQTVLVPNMSISLTVTLRVHDGATLDSVTVNWIVPWSHTPVTVPAFRVLRLDAFGNASVMSSTATGADANGYFYPTASGASQWYNNGQPQSLEVIVDTDNVISIANYTYVLEIIEEQGVTGFPWSAQCFAQSCAYVDTSGSVLPTGSQTIDGVSVPTITYVLLTNQPDPTQNGLWITSSSGSWQRISLPLSSGAIFWVQQGNVNAQTYWQCPAISGNQNIQLWTSSTPHIPGDIVAPVTGGIGLVALCTTGGTTNTSEPSWPNVSGATVTDGSVTWTMQATSLPSPNISLLKDPLGLVTGVAGGFAAFGNIWLPAACNFSGISDCRWE